MKIEGKVLWDCSGQWHFSSPSSTISPWHVMTAWLFRLTRWCWWLSASKKHPHSYPLVWVRGGDQPPVLGPEGMEDRPYENKMDNKVRTNRQYFLGLWQMWKTFKNIKHQFYTPPCWSSLPGHPVCGSTALPCWPSHPGPSSYTTSPCWPSLPG